MEYPGKEHTLKDGTLLLIRSLDEADAPVMLDYLPHVFGETCNLSRCPDEVHMTEEEEGGIIRGIKDSPKGIMLGAFVKEELVSAANIVPIRSLDRHRGGFGISVKRSYCGRGIAGLMMETALGCARRAGLKQVELEVLEDNRAAVSLYRKYGFKEYGHRVRGIKTRDGSYRDELLMALFL